ncbi:flagellar protein FlhE [Pantoea sp. ME81]|uniref:flagellar protein FlhE n=1 Tax=Pantoea sp. ME81 TaxID=2743935 RepID=UPI0015F5A69C|nr:flagellar protein FlhE [Pantoea sp. ME81]
MRSWMWVGLLLFSPLALAAEGSWSSQSFGGVITQGKQVFKSRPVQPAVPLPAGAMARHLAWRIAVDGPVPMGFQVQVCGGGRCVRLPGLRGEMALPHGFPAGGPLWFEYFSAVRGTIAPAVTVLSNQVTVGYWVR